MRLLLFLTLVFIGTVLVAYSVIEKRINQRSCKACGFSFSKDALYETCAHCGAEV